MKTLLTAQETANYLKVGIGTIHRWTHQGFVPYIKLGGAVRYDQEKLDEWIEKRSTEGRTKQKINSTEAGTRLLRRDLRQPVTFELDEPRSPAKT